MKLLLSVLSALLLATPVWSATLQGDCDIRFHGTSTFVNFDGSGSCTPFVVEVNNDLSRAEVLPEGEVLVPIDGMTTGIGARDRDMRKMFDSATWPMVRGRIGAIDARKLLTQMTAQGSEARLGLDLILRDASRPVSARVTRFVDTEEEIRLDFAFEVSLKDFGIKPPRVFLLVKVGNLVDVEVSAVFKKPLDAD